MAGRDVPQVVEAERFLSLFADAHEDHAEQPFLFVVVCVRQVGNLEDQDKVQPFRPQKQVVRRSDASLFWSVAETSACKSKRLRMSA